MKFKHRLLALAVGSASLATMSLPAVAGVDVNVRIAPPAPRVEAVPAPRVGYVWTPGYWNWNGRTHVWVGGTYVRERPGYAYTQPAWVERDGAYHFQRGGWARHDGDHDGIPNAVDRDRDNDGIRNARDPHPYQPR